MTTAGSRAVFTGMDMAAPEKRLPGSRRGLRRPWGRDAINPLIYLLLTGATLNWQSKGSAWPDPKQEVGPGMQKVHIAACAAAALGLCLISPNGAAAVPAAPESGKIYNQVTKGDNGLIQVRAYGGFRGGGIRGGGIRGGFGHGFGGIRGGVGVGRVGFHRAGFHGGRWGGRWHGAGWHRAGWRRGYWGGGWDGLGAWPWPSSNGLGCGSWLSWLWLWREAMAGAVAAAVAGAVVFPF